jgi:N-acetyl-anhydromuramyl-L-alanine amidase AmpD
MSISGNLADAGWDVQGKPVAGTGGTFTPTHVMVHHYAGSESASSSSSEAAAARSSFDHSPICHLYLDVTSKVHTITDGKANHAGEGSYPGIPRDEGNRYCIGIEVQCKGTHDLATHESYGALIVLCADLLRSIGQTSSKYVIGHREYAPDRKIDPLDNMDTLRADVARALDSTTDEEDDGMTLVKRLNANGSKTWALLHGRRVTWVGDKELSDYASLPACTMNEKLFADATKGYEFT